VHSRPFHPPQPPLTEREVKGKAKAKSKGNPKFETKARIESDRLCQTSLNRTRPDQTPGRQE